MNDETRSQRLNRKLRWLVPVGTALLRVLASTWRIREVNVASLRDLRAAGRPVIFVLWHGHLLPLVWHHREQEITLLVSEHGDGELITRVAAKLGYRAVRGSSTRGAERALVGMIRIAEKGGDLAFTPDGPRGPAENFAPGALVVAQRSGAPLVPIAAGAKRSWRLRSWDSFRIPKPFARVTVAYGDPIFVTTSSAREAAELTGHCQQVLRQVAAAADE